MIFKGSSFANLYLITLKRRQQNLSSLRDQNSTWKPAIINPIHFGKVRHPRPLKVKWWHTESLMIHFKVMRSSKLKDNYSLEPTQNRGHRWCFIKCAGNNVKGSFCAPVLKQRESVWGEGDSQVFFLTCISRSIVPSRKDLCARIGNLLMIISACTNFFQCSS